MIRYLVPLILVVAFAMPADAQSRRELGRRLDAVEARLAEMEAQRIAQTDQFLQRIADLEFQLQESTGRVERLEFSNRQLTEEVSENEDEIDRLRRELADLRRRSAMPDMEASGLDSASPGMTGASGEPGTGSGDAGPRNLTGREFAVTDADDPFAEERANATRPLGAATASASDRAPVMSANQAYGQARAKLLDGDFAGAQEDFANFISDYPEDGLIDEAWFWLGETHFVQGEYSSAAEAYIASLREQRDGPVAPDALVRLASSLGALGRNDEACSTLARFSREFPSAGPNARARAERESLRAGCR
ncbi:tol-pal system protein YbgF [Hyphobacterium sp.]|uniref:tol-pal system protein YbgF n=1 Tax=Hyphobacterium sp. TaxID=2004662 RepID=UPI003BA890CF